MKIINTTQSKLLVQEIIDGLKADSERKVKITGLGVFVVKQMAERKGRNPATGAEITIPARRKVAFRTGKAFKEAVL